MFERIIRLAIEQRWLIMMAVIGMAAAGLYNYRILPIDAVPDITNVQVQINTSAPGYSPLEVEQRITYPLETVMAGLPHLEQTRSLSRYGLSQFTEAAGNADMNEHTGKNEQAAERSINRLRPV